jgi:cell division protein FtsL
MNPFGFFDRRVRGFRIVEVGALGVLLVLILTVYLAKTGAGGKRADIDRIQGQITDEQIQIRMLRAEVATLEQPSRLEALAAYLQLGPISARREITVAALPDVAHVAVVDHKTALIVSDPLTAVGSPDVTKGPAPVAPAAGAVVPAATPAVPAPAAVASLPAATKPGPVPSAHPAMKLADAAPMARHGAKAVLHHAAEPAGDDGDAN